MTDGPDRERFRRLPEAVRPQDMVETVDTTVPPARESDTEDRDRMLRLAGGG